ncbi:MAG TPA: lactonase family protein [Herpetosiphonaceae bacterium]|nr:lactonase family protein [Herpetosiphonaceae bacterium]
MSSDAPGGNILAYIGTYTRTEPHVQGKAEGIYVYRVDPASGAMEYQSTARGVTNPSFVVVDARRRFLYAVEEVDQFDGQPGGAACAFAIDPDTGDLGLLNRQPTHGTHPCYAGIDHTGRWLLVANYGGGSVCMLPIGEDGTLGAATDVVQHHGPSPHHDGPHPHSIMPTPDNRYVLVPDCGLDRVYVYHLDHEHGTLTPNDPLSAPTGPASGPRHLAFHPNGTRVYSINEHGSSITAFAYDPAGGTLSEFQTISTLPEGFSGRNTCADIHFDPSGRWLYGSNRGHDSIAIFAVDQPSGKLQPLGHMPTGGRTPRNFAIDPRGRFLLAANQDTGTVVTFGVDRATGALAATGHVAEIPAPVCIALVGS